MAIICMYAYPVNAQMHLFMHEKCVGAWKPRSSRVWRFHQGEKKPAKGRVYLEKVWLAGVHAPPEDVTEDDDLLFLDFLEAVVLVRVFIAIEAAQTNAGGQAVKLLHA